MIPYIDIHTHHPQSDPDIISHRIGGEPLSGEMVWIGIHPWDVNKVSDKELDSLISTDISGYEGVGEIGLDYRIADANRERQRLFLIRQLDWAARNGKPVQLHIVGAWEDFFRIWEDGNYATKLSFSILHGFIGTKEVAERLTRNRIWLSFGQRALHSPKTLEALRSLDGKFFLESDEASVDIKDIYALYTKELGLTINQLKEQIKANYDSIVVRENQPLYGGGEIK